MVFWIDILLYEFHCNVEGFLKDSPFSYSFLKKNSWRITDNKISLVAWLELCDPLSFLVLEEILKNRSFEVSEDLKKKIEQVNWELIIQRFSIPFLKGQLTNILVDILSVEEKQHPLNFIENFRENYKKASPSSTILSDLIERKEKSWKLNPEQKDILEKDVQEQEKQWKDFFLKEENNISKILKNYLFERKENIEKIKEDLYQKWNKKDTNSIISFLEWMEKQSFPPYFSSRYVFECYEYYKKKIKGIEASSPTFNKTVCPNHNLFPFVIKKELWNFAYEEAEYIFHRKKAKVWLQYAINKHDLSGLYNSIFLPELPALYDYRSSSFLEQVKGWVKTLEEDNSVIKLEKEELCSDSNCLSWWIFFHHPLSLLAFEEIFIKNYNLDIFYDFVEKTGCEGNNRWFLLIKSLLTLFWETNFVQALLGIDRERIEVRDSLQNQTSSENETPQIDYRNVFQTNYSNLISSLKENEIYGRETRVMTTFFREEENIVLSVIENWISKFEKNIEVKKKDIGDQFILKWKKIMELESSISWILRGLQLFNRLQYAENPIERNPRIPVYMRTEGIERLLEKKVEETLIFYEKNSKFKQENRAARLTGKSLVARKVITNPDSTSKIKVVITNPDSISKNKVNILIVFLIIVLLLVSIGTLVFFHLKKRKLIIARNKTEIKLRR